MANTQTDASQEAEPGRRRGRYPLWQVLLGVGLILAAVGRYVWTNYRPRPAIRLDANPTPVKVAADFAEADAVPAKAGDLRGFNVLLITMDTTRADRLGCYGNETIRTPVLDRLAREGVIFSRAEATAPSTVPSHASILTGLYPAHHGARVNGMYRLDGRHTTLAEALAAQGYDTGAVVSAFVLDSRFGLDQGFQSYDDDLRDAEQPALYRYQERKADATTDRAVRWLRQGRDQPFFLWVHYFDPHAVYDPPSPYREQSVNPYDGEIAFVDAQVGRLLEALDEAKVSDRTLVVVVGDHAESLGQHGESTHAFLTYEATLKVPLIMRCGARLGGKVHIDRRVSQVDLMPTVLSLLGAAVPGGLDGVDLTQPIPEDRPIFAESLHGMLVFGWAALEAVYVGPLKYIHGPEPELYDLAKDPNELNDLIGSRPDRVAAMRQALAAVFGDDLDMAQVAPPTMSLSASDLQKLQGLGYVASAARLPDPSARPNPKRMMPALNEVERIVYEDQAGAPVTPAGRIAKLEAIAERYPNFHPAFRFLGDQYRLNGEAEKARVAYLRCLDLCPDAISLMNIAVTELHLGNNQAAEKYLAQIVSRYPDHLHARCYLGLIAGQQKHYDEAVEHFRRVFEADPEYRLSGSQPIGVLLSQACTAQGQADDLGPYLEAQLKARPDSAGVRGTLATYYASRKEYARAEQLLREGIERHPDDRVAISDLAMFLVGCPDAKYRNPFEGVRMMEQLCEQTHYRDPHILSQLSVLYAMMTRFDEAIALTEKARKIAEDRGDLELVKAFDQLLAQQKQAKAAGPPQQPPGIPPGQEKPNPQG